MIILAVDLGKARTGIAVSDNGESFAFPKTVITEYNTQKLIEKIAAAVKEAGAELIVVGKPKNMDGSEGERAEKSRTFAAMLEERTGLEVVLWDERRSSIEAPAILHANGRRKKDHRKNVDAVAAQLMLEGYLGRL